MNGKIGVRYFNHARKWFSIRIRCLHSTSVVSCMWYVRALCVLPAQRLRERIQNYCDFRRYIRVIKWAGCTHTVYEYTNIRTIEMQMDAIFHFAMEIIEWQISERDPGADAQCEWPFWWFWSIKTVWECIKIIWWNSDVWIWLLKCRPIFPVTYFIQHNAIIWLNLRVISLLKTRFQWSRFFVPIRQ